MENDAITALKRLTELWAEYTSQDMYGESLRAALLPESFETWQTAHDKAREVVKLAQKPTQPAVSMQELWAELTPNQREWIINTWHISRVHSHKRYDRVQYVCRWFVKEFGGIWAEHQSGLYKIIDQLTTV